MRDRIEIVEDNGEYALVRVKAEDLPRLKIQKAYRETLLDSYIYWGFPQPEFDMYDEDGKLIYDKRGFPKTKRSRRLKKEFKEGNIVLGYQDSNILMLDCDLKTEDEVIKFSVDYAKFADLGSSLVILTSESFQMDLLGNRLGNYAIIFGRLTSNEEQKWHVKEAFRVGMVDEGFVVIRKFGSITERVNAKNDKIPPPTIVHFFKNGDKSGRVGIWSFLKYWGICREMGIERGENNG